MSTKQDEAEAAKVQEANALTVKLEIEILKLVRNHKPVPSTLMDELQMAQALSCGDPRKKLALFDSIAKKQKKVEEEFSVDDCPTEVLAKIAYLDEKGQVPIHPDMET